RPHPPHHTLRKPLAVASSASGSARRPVASPPATWSAAAAPPSRRRRDDTQTVPESSCLGPSRPRRGDRGHPLVGQRAGCMLHGVDTMLVTGTPAQVAVA